MSDLTSVGNQASTIAWNNLRRVLKENDLSLNDLSDIHDLDDLLDDGGFARNEKIFDPADDYIMRFFRFSESPDSLFTRARDIVITFIQEKLDLGIGD